MSEGGALMALDAQNPYLNNSHLFNFYIYFSTTNINLYNLNSREPTLPSIVPARADFLLVVVLNPFCTQTCGKT
jgi:hypothetical protein